MSIFVVSGVMNRADGVTKLIHGISRKEKPESVIGEKTIEWLKQYPGFAIEKIICTEITEALNKASEDILPSDKLNSATNNDTGSETKT